MQSQLSAILLKAMLEVHEIVATMHEHLSPEFIAAYEMNAVVEEVKLQKDLQWKQNEVSELSL